MDSCAANQPTPLADAPDTLAAATSAVAGADRAALATFAAPGAPVGSVVTLVPARDLDLRFSLCQGSEHAANIARDARATVVIGHGGASRVMLPGRARSAGQDARGNLLYRLDLETLKVSVAGSDPICVQLRG